jgi:hypothetical protein
MSFITYLYPNISCRIDITYKSFTKSRLNVSWCCCALLHHNKSIDGLVVLTLLICFYYLVKVMTPGLWLRSIYGIVLWHLKNTLFLINFSTNGLSICWELFFLNHFIRGCKIKVTYLFILLNDQFPVFSK